MPSKTCQARSSLRHWNPLGSRPGDFQHPQIGTSADLVGILAGFSWQIWMRDIFSKAKHHFKLHMATKIGTKNVYHSEVGKPTSLSVRNGCSRTSKGPVSLQLGMLPVGPFKFVLKQNMFQASIRHGTGLGSGDWGKATRLVIKWNKFVCGWFQSMDHDTSSSPVCNKY